MDVCCGVMSEFVLQSRRLYDFAVVFLLVCVLLDACRVRGAVVVLGGLVVVYSQLETCGISDAYFVLLHVIIAWREACWCDKTRHCDDTRGLHVQCERQTSLHD